MRRWLVPTVGFITVVTLGGLWTEPADAQTPGENGRISYVQDTKNCDDCIVKSVEPDGTGTVTLPGGGIGAYSPDGTHIATLYNVADGRIATMVMDSDGANITAFVPPDTFNVACPVWSPDGEKLLCEVWDDAHPEHLPGLFTVNASDGSDLTRLTTNTLGGHDIPNDYSPDGSQIVFLRESPGHGSHARALFVANADGGGAHRITGWLNDSACCQASWSPDGTRIAFAAQGRLRTVLADGSSMKTLKVDTGAQFYFLSSPSWSPDGTRIAFVMWTSNTGEFDLFTISADGSDLRQLTDTHREEGFPNWGTAP
jgi:Tol biopolymer transport system component